jgi:protein involved in polysaccharide export with SLBB domain
MNETIYVVTPAGTLQLPNLKSEVKVAGLTMAQAASAIAAAIDRDLGVAPTKVEFIGWYRDGASATGKPVLVGGAVRKPGPVVWRVGMTVDEAIAEAGGIDGGDRLKVVVVGADGLDVSARSLVPAGATVYVPAGRKAIEVTVQGAIRLPGKLSVFEGSTLAATIGLARGFSPQAGQKVFLRRPGVPVAEYLRVDVTDGKLSDVTVADGDVITVETAPFFYVNGEVKKSTSEYKWEPTMTLQQAIALAGGLTDQGALNRVTVKRKNAAGKFERLKLEKDFLSTPIKPQDVITVPKKWM